MNSDRREQRTDHRWSAAARVRFLTDAGTILASLNYQRALAALARHVVPAIAEWWTFDLLEKDGAVRRVVAYADPPLDAVAEELVGRYPPWPSAQSGPLLAMQTGQPQAFNAMAHPAQLALSESPAHLDTLRRLGLGPAVCVPISFRGSILGAMTFVRFDSRHRPSTIAMARALGSRVGQTVAHGLIYEELQDSNRAKDEFLAMLGHELRNPLAALTNAVAVLERAELPRDVQMSLQAIIGRQTRHLTKLVAELLDVTRLNSGKIVLELSPTDLRELAERCVAMLQRTRTDDAHEIRLSGEPTLVFGDSVRLEQVIDNLLDNASKFTPPGGRIDIRIEKDGRQAILRIKDTGVGVAPELLPRMFDPFTQGVQGIERHQGGLGLGLAIVQRLVDLHGGTVQACSAGPGCGTEIVIRLPLANAHHLTAAAAASDGVTASPRQRYRILVVEDNADARETLRLLLKLGGHQVELAEDGPAGLTAAVSKRPEVALIDLGLPGLDGYAVAKIIRSRPGGGAIGLIAVTGYGQPHDRRRASEAGFDAYLVKPFDRATLEQAIESCAGGGMAPNTSAAYRRHEEADRLPTKLVERPPPGSETLQDSQ